MGRKALILAIAVIVTGGVLVLAALMAKQRSDEVLTEFREVDSGLGSLQLRQDERLSKDREWLLEHGCTDLVAQAEELHHVLIDIAARIDTMKTEIVASQEGLDDLEVADQVFQENSRGAALFNMATIFVERAEAITADTVIDKRIDAAARSMGLKGPLVTWHEFNFDRMPAVASVTSLSKMRSDLAAIEGLVMQDLMARCK